jgi:hypothetical protein
LAASIFCAVAFGLVLILQPAHWKPYAAIALSAGLIAAFLIFTMNQRLKAVEIGQDYLSPDYGRDTDIRNIRLIHSSPDSAVLESIIEKFRYETGITPTITR